MPDGLHPQANQVGGADELEHGVDLGRGFHDGTDTESHGYHLHIQTPGVVTRGDP
jgi:hypothetical protein